MVLGPISCLLLAVSHKVVSWARSFFLLYINDLSMSIDCQLSLYADDSALLFAHSDPTVIASRLSIELSNCRKWLIDSKLSLHVRKTECLIFGSKNRLRRVGDFQVVCEGRAVRRVFQVKYLGVFLDASLSGFDHANYVLKACIGRLAFLDFNSRRTLCSSLIQPNIDYCCSSWYEGLTASLRRKLDVLQRKMVRFVHGYENRHHVGPSDILSLSWLSIRDRVSYFKLIYLFRIKHGQGPRYLRSNKGSSKKKCFANESS